jgi:hypothetical protein
MRANPAAGRRYGTCRLESCIAASVTMTVAASFKAGQGLAWREARGQSAPQTTIQKHRVTHATRIGGHKASFLKLQTTPSRPAHLMFLTPRCSSVSRMTTAFCSSQLRSSDSGSPFTSVSNTLASASATTMAAQAGRQGAVSGGCHKLQGSLGSAEWQVQLGRAELC